MPHRSPTAADIGKTVEVSNDEKSWHNAVLHGFSVGTVESYHASHISLSRSIWSHCRVPYSCPDPIAELSMAADLLAERGAPEAARVLMDQRISNGDWIWPTWLIAPWIAVDANDCWWAFASEPMPTETGYDYAADRRVLHESGGSYNWVTRFTPPPFDDWRTSKRRNPDPSIQERPQPFSTWTATT